MNRKITSLTIKPEQLEKPFEWLMACNTCHFTWRSLSKKYGQICPKCKSIHTIHDDMTQFGCNGDGTCLFTGRKI